MGPAHGAEFFRPGDAGKAHEILYRVLVGAPCAPMPRYNVQNGPEICLQAFGRFTGQ
jgi:hypothetical protein